LTGATRRSAISELTEEITRFGDEQKQAGYINEFGWAKLLTKIKTLGRNPDFSAPSLLMQATMHGISGDVVRAKKMFDQYSASYGKTMPWYIIRASLARIIGEPLSVIEMLECGYPFGDLNNLHSAMSACTDSGFYCSAYKILLDIEKINPAFSRKLVESMPGVIPAARYIADHGLDEVRISERVLMLTKLVNNSGYMLRISRVLTTEAGIIYEVVIDDDIEKLAALNLKLYEELAINFDFTYSKHVSVGVSPMENRYVSE